MNVKFSDKTNDDFDNYREYLSYLREKGIDVHIPKNEEDEHLEEKLEKSLSELKVHKDSIYPDSFDYGKGNYKMYVDKKSHRILFYNIEKDSKDNSYISIERCPHSLVFKKELKREGIKPEKDCDPELEKDLVDVEYEDEIRLSNNYVSKKITNEYNKKCKELEKRIKSKRESNEKERDKEDSQQEKGKEDSSNNWKRIKKQRGKGLTKSYYKNGDRNSEHISQEDYKKRFGNGEKNESIKNMKSVKTYITESKMVSLVDYLKKMVG